MDGNIRQHLLREVYHCQLLLLSGEQTFTRTVHTPDSWGVVETSFPKIKFNAAPVDQLSTVLANA